MREIKDDAGRRYLLLKRSHDSSLVVDLRTGARTYRPNESLTAVSDRDDSADQDLLSYIATNGPVPVRTLLDATPLCESDLHGVLTLLRANDLVQETELHGERAYEMVPGDRS